MSRNIAISAIRKVCTELARMIFLNDFRWSAQVLPWKDMLLLLEGQPVHFSAPKTHYAQDIPQRDMINLRLYDIQS